ncbi:hypothetical protein BX616_003980 [Lobosporangium transversale]|uniref:Uncharacterized protein n=1 Tax=Lobosporangium transversale TaxID=64571 RepID=A0A1Y2GZ12_9FUNG|nr:hypothetical protein BCR41DRAFT_346898 [Lobosporangium transversale]KAF9918945.1 hypothetical protein BX616_003980 [Lobosporangium transversale]ORZ27506.1 hypothetical protein BCR41DRAFT_346898 [Lobosporangium transversale]|eukprot:XP_021885233.1 hypothetical protein BCR41DRAFT_346898 [Lobosporangium transversale]
MGLATFQSVIRYSLMLVALTAFGFDMFFLYVYIHYPEVVMFWRYYAGTALVGFLFLILVFSEIGYRIKNAQRRRYERQYNYSSQQYVSFSSLHTPSLVHPVVASPPFAAAATTVVPGSSEPEGGVNNNYKNSDNNNIHGNIVNLLTAPDDAYHLYPRYGIVTPIERRSSCVTAWSIIRFLAVWLISAGLLNISIQAYQRHERQIFTLPFQRDTQDRADIYDGRYGIYNPRDLYNCPHIVRSNLLSYLCVFDQVALGFYSLAGLLAVAEGIAAVIVENRTRATFKGLYNPNDDIANKMWGKQKKSIDSMVKRRSEVYDQAEMGNAHVLTIPDHSTTLSTDNALEMCQYGLAHAKACMYDDKASQERPLPPLPARPAAAQEKDMVESDQYQNSHAFTSTAAHIPLEGNAKEGQHSRNTVLDSLVDHSALDSKEDSTAATMVDPTGNQPGPSNSFPVDIKRSDGL